MLDEVPLPPLSATDVTVRPPDTVNPLALLATGVNCWLSTTVILFRSSMLALTIAGFGASTVGASV